MKVIDAVWEKRNLEVSTCVIVIEECDDVEDVIPILEAIQTEYFVIKLPSSKIEFLFPLQKIGFLYVEDMVKLVSNLSEIKLNPVQQRLYDVITTQEMTDDDIEQLKQEIKKGLFNSDRVFIDPAFSEEQASRRYINWVTDEYRQGTSFIKYVHKDRTIGFFALRELGCGRYTSFLGGIYPEYRKGGIGSIVKVPEYVRYLNGKTVETSVSTNNPAQIRNLISWGYVPEGITHTFIKHI